MNLFPPVFEMENICKIHRRHVNLTKELSPIFDLESGTVIIRFRNYEIPSFSPLLNIVNDQYPSSYFLIYLQFACRIGCLKKIINSNGTLTQQMDIFSNEQAPVNLINTIAVRIEKGVGYRLYLNGRRLREYTDSSACFLHDIHSLSPIRTALIGRTVESQKLENKRAIFQGDIDFIRIYSQVLPEDYLLAITGETTPDYSIHIPEGTRITAPSNIFYSGYQNAPYYSIPSMIQTREGTLLAAADQRFHGPGEYPNRIHTIIRRSTDKGETFEDAISVVSMPENSQSIDSCMVQDQETGRIFLLVDQHPENVTISSVHRGTGFILENGIAYRRLHDDDGIEYLQAPDGHVTRGGKATAYYVNKKHALFCDGQFLGYTFTENCPLRVYSTTYLVLVYSDDDGKSWSDPIDLNPILKEDWMYFFGCSPGHGIQLRHGPYKGRLLLPTYYVNEYGIQSPKLIYSDDHGKSWRCGESFNDNRIVDGQLYHSRTMVNKRFDSSEPQVIELPNGDVLLYSKSPFNSTGCISVATSHDGGETFLSDVEYDSTLHSTDSISIISCNWEIDGHAVILYAGSDSLNGCYNGSVKAGLLIEENNRYRIDWKYSRLIKPGTFGHCCLSPVDSDGIGLFYEGSRGLSLSFIKMDARFLMSRDLPLHPVELCAVDLLPGQGGCEILLKFNQVVMLYGDRFVYYQKHGKTFSARYIKRAEDSRSYHFWAEDCAKEEIQECWLPKQLNIVSVNGFRYQYSRSLKQLVWCYYLEETDRLSFSNLNYLGVGFRSEFSDNTDSADSDGCISQTLRCNSESTILEILQYIQNNYSLALTLTGLSKIFHINSTYLGRIFTLRVGQTFNDYLVSYRIAKAKELLREKDYMVYEISRIVGYTDINHFYQLFKKNCGMTPSEYRNSFFHE